MKCLEISQMQSQFSLKLEWSSLVYNQQKFLIILKIWSIKVGFTLYQYIKPPITNLLVSCMPIIMYPPSLTSNLLYTTLKSRAYVLIGNSECHLRKCGLFIISSSWIYIFFFHSIKLVEWSPNYCWSVLDILIVTYGRAQLQWTWRAIQSK
jgi:hypothetical protein